MENTETVGSLLKRERESRELSLQDVMDATKITVHNLSALEEDRFDYFPNRVYTRAFLRDYANYLGLDSVALLDRYEQVCGSAKDTSVRVPAGRRSGFKTVAEVLLVVLIVGAIAAAAYVYKNGRGMGPGVPRSAQGTVEPGTDGVATLPRVPVEPKPEPLPEKPAVEPEKPVEAPKPAVPDKLSLEVTAVKYVYLKVIVDGNRVFEGFLNAGDVKTWEARKELAVRYGMGYSVQLKMNGKAVPIENPTKPDWKEFTLPEPPPAEPAGGESAASAPADSTSSSSP